MQHTSEMPHDAALRGARRARSGGDFVDDRPGAPSCCWPAACSAAGLPFALEELLRAFQVTLAVIYAIAIPGLNLLTGFNGQFSLGHSAFYAIGAYTAATT